MPKTIIVSNRLPVQVNHNAEGITYKPSAGGLATGLGSIYKERDNIWIGWPGLYLDDEQDKQQVTEDLNKENMHPVFLTPDEIKDFYEGFSNETLWPTFHYFMQYAKYNPDHFEVYRTVNEKFCQAILEFATPGDTIWIHDYQLLLLPLQVRNHLPKSSIGFFQHIPFPSYEVFRLLPWRKELLMGMLGADLIGFHTYDDMRHFLSSVNRLAGYSNAHGQVDLPNRKVVVDSFPMGIDYQKYADSANSKGAMKRMERYTLAMRDTKLLLSIDRLDYSKGIPQRLKAFEMFLKENPEYIEKVSLMIILVPSRDKVEKYQELKEEIDLLVGRINGNYGKISWTPIHYFYRTFPLEALSAFYRMAQVGFVTPMRDGMNLVCKEFVASKLEQQGVLILSEMAGASKELSDALLINPNDIHQIVRAIKQALEMPEDEQKRRMKIMQTSLKRYNIHHWVKLFMDRLNGIKEIQKQFATQHLKEEYMQQLLDDYKNASNRQIFLDYDGTLVGFTDDPNDARPDDELNSIMKGLTSDKKNNITTISGRDRKILSEWLGDFSLHFIAEHGVWSKRKGEDWELPDGLNNEWKDEIRDILELYVNRTPGSFIEEKDYSLVWHYRKVETGLGELRIRELTSHLKYITATMDLLVMEGDHVVEVKSNVINKGVAAKKWLDKSADFILAIGDDHTDEDTFKAMPSNAYTIKVGINSSMAKYYVDNFKEVRKLLSKMLSS